MFNSILTFLGLFSVGAFFIYLLLVYIFPRLHRWRVAKEEMPEAWERVLNNQVKGFMDLGDQEKEAVRKLLKVYMAEKFFEPKRMKWDQQILICAYLAMALHGKRGKFLSRLSTIKIGKAFKEGQGFLQVPAPEDLLKIEYKKWS